MIRQLLNAAGARRPRDLHPPRHRLFEALEPRVLLALATWDAGGDGASWSDPLNWSADVLPGLSDDVHVPGGFTELTLDRAVTVGSLLAQSPLLLTSDARLNVGSSARFEGGLSTEPEAFISAGSRIELAGPGPRHDGFVTLSGTFRAPSILLNARSAAINLSNATLDASDPVGRGGRVDVFGVRVVLQNTTLDASGPIAGGQIRVGGDRSGAPIEGVINAQIAYLDQHSTLRADATHSGDGGRVIFWADDIAGFYGRASARGGALAGNGGFVETSGKSAIDALGEVDVLAPSGAAGTWLIDPHNVTISTAAQSGGIFSGGNPNTFTPNANNAVVNIVTLNNLLATGATVIITTGATGSQAGNITLNSPVSVSASNPGILTLRAAGDILINANISMQGTFTPTVNLFANDPTPGPDPQPGVGSVILASAVSISLSGGTLNVSGVDFTTQTTGLLNPGILTANMSGNVLINGDILATTRIELTAGNDGSGALSFGAAGVEFRSANIALRAGDGAGGAGAAAADLNTNLPIFRGAQGGASRPASFTYRQDATIADANIPAPARFGAAIGSMNYSIISDDGSITVTTASKVANAFLGFAAAGNVTINPNVGFGTLNVVADAEGNGSGTATVLSSQSNSALSIAGAIVSIPAGLTFDTVNSAFFIASGAATILSPVSIAEGAILVQGATVTLGASLTANFGIQLVGGPGGITQTGGAITCGQLIAAATGPISLAGNNDVDSAAFSAQGNLTFNDIDAFNITTITVIDTLSGASSTGITALTISGAGAITINRAVTSELHTLLDAPGGATTTATGIITGTALLLRGGSAGASYTLATSIANLASDANANLTISDANGFAVGTIAGVVGISSPGRDVFLTAGSESPLAINSPIAINDGRLVLTAAGPVTQTAAGTIITGTLLLQGNGPFTLTNPANNTISLVANTGSGAISYVDANAMLISSVFGVTGIDRTGPVSVVARGNLFIQNNVFARSSSISLQSGASGAGNLSFTAVGVIVAAPSISLIAGDGLGGGGAGATLDVNTNTPSFRLSPGSANNPVTFELRQDAAINDATLPLPARFAAGNVAALDYRIESGDSTITISTPSRVATSDLTLTTDSTSNISTVLSLRSLLVNGTTRMTAGSLNANNAVTFTGDLSLLIDFTVNAGAFSALALVSDGATPRTLTVNAAGSTSLLGGANLLGINISAPGATVLAGDFVIDSNLTFAEPVSIQGPASITSTGAVVFNSTLNVGAQSLVIIATEINFNGGANSVSGSGSLTLSPDAAGTSINVFAPIDVFSALDLTPADMAALAPGFSSIIIGRAGGSGGILIRGGTVVNPITFLNNGLGGSIVLNTAPLVNTSAGSLAFVAGLSTLSSGITSAGGDVSFSASLAIASALTIQTSGGDITVSGPLNSTLANPALTLNVGAGRASLLGAVGNTSPLGSLLISGASTLAGGSVQTTGPQTYSGALTLATAATTTFTGTLLNFSVINATTPGAQGLIARAPASFAGAIGAVTPLGSLSAESDALFTASVALTSSGGQSGDLSVSGSTTLSGSPDTIIPFVTSPGSFFTFSAGLAAASPGEQGLSINGNLRLAGAPANAVPLRSLSVTGSTTITGPGSIRTSAIGGGSGNQSFTGPVNVAADATFDSFSGALTFGSTLSAGINDVTLRGRLLAFNGLVSGAGDLIIEHDLPTGGIVVGGSDGPGGALDLSPATLSRLADGFNSVTFGRSDGSGVITIASPYTALDPTTFRSPIAPGAIIVNAPLSGSGNGSFSFFGSGATTTLNADVRTDGRPITFNDSVLIGVALVTIDTTNNGQSPAGAPISFLFAVDSEDNENNALVVNSGTAGLTAFSAPVGAATLGRLSALTTDGSAGTAPTRFAAAVNVLTQTYNDPVTIAGPAAFTGQSILFAQNVEGFDTSSALSLAPAGAGAIATFAGSVGAATPLSTIASSAGILSRFGASPVRSTLAQSYAGPIALLDDITFSGGAVAFLGGILGNANALVVNSPGVTSFAGAVSGLLSLLTDAPGSTSIAGPTLTASSLVTFADAVVFTADAFVASLGATLTFGSTLAAGANSIVLSGVEINFLGAVSGTGTLRLLQSGPSQNYNLAHGTEGAGDALDITAAELTLFAEGFELLAFGSDDGAAVMDVESFEFNASIQINMPAMGGEIFLADGIVCSTDNGTIEVRGNGSTTHIFGLISTRGGAITIDDSIILESPLVTFDTTVGNFPGAPVVVRGRVNSLPGAAHSLRVNAGIATMTFDSEVGGFPLAGSGRPGFLDIHAAGGTFLNGPAFRTVGPQTYTGPVTLGPVVLLQTQGAPINVTGGVDGESNLTIGPGTGAVSFGGSVGGVTRLTSLTINSGAARVFNGAVSVQVLTVFGGSVEFNGLTNVLTGLLIAGTLGGSGDIRVELPFTWVGGDMIGSGRTIIRDSGSLVISGASPKTLARSIESHGVTFWTDGSLNFDAGAFINRPNAQFFAQSNGAFVGVEGQAASAFTNEGFFERSGTPGSAAALTNLVISNSGVMSIASGDLDLTPAATSLFASTGRLEIASASSVNVSGAAAFGPGSTFATTLAGTQPGQFGRLIASGPVTVDGRLEVSLANGYLPIGGESFRIIEGSSVTGTFASESFPPLPGLQFLSIFNPADVTLSIAGGLDFNGDGNIDADDLGDFINAFFSMPPDPRADFNGDGNIDADDLGDFINAFFG
ncbi:MAG: beta strand repeat-containing protein [Phycisphaerales bacterium]